MDSAATDASEAKGPRQFDVVIVGAGVAGIGMLRRLRDEGYSVVVLESGAGVGGTWYWNRYPGACCDSAYEVYSYSFSNELLQEWEWETKLPAGDQVLSYLEHVVDRFDLAPYIELNKRVASATFEVGEQVWRTTTDSGERFVSKFLLTAVGNLSDPVKPDYPGVDDFQGKVYFTARWPHEEVELRGKKVGVIGTGSTGIQVIQTIAAEVEHLTVFQRTPNYSIPARNEPLDPEIQAKAKANYAEIREEARWTPTGNLAWPDEKSAFEVTEAERQAQYQKHWDEGGFNLLIAGYWDIYTNLDANKTAADFVRDKIRSIVKDPETAKKLLPLDHPIGAKRPPLDTGYFETFNRENVTLVDIRSERIERFTEQGIQTLEGHYDLDVVIFATGFDAVTGTLNKIDIGTSEGLKLTDVWANGPRTYLGVATEGFPNLFMISGPQSPSVMATVTITIEQHIEFIGDLLHSARERGYDLIAVTAEAQDEWVAHVNEVMAGTIIANTNSWYWGANLPDKPRGALTYVGGSGEYRKRCNEIRDAGYPGFTFEHSRQLTPTGG